MATQNPLSVIGYRTPTLDDVKEVVPAAFSKNPAPERSEHYSFVSTEELLDTFEKLNWTPYSSKQNGNSPFARHMIRLNNDNLGYLNLRGNDKVKPQIILDNSHNGGSCAQLHMGLFRLVCTNGLVIAMPGMYTNVKFRHMGVNFNELQNLTEQIAIQYNEIGTRVNDMIETKMDQEKAEEFVIKAMAYREPAYFINKEDGSILISKVTKVINPEEILKPVREADKIENLWNVFNIVQERMVKGKFERKSLKTGRVSRPRALTGATRNLQFNKLLWGIAEEVLAENN
jgi:phage terminase large subunit-like protein